MQSLSAQSQLTPDTYYLTVYITDTTVQSALWQIKNGKLEVTETSDTHTYSDEKSCLIETDKSLQELGSASEGVSNTIFGFEPEWLDSDGIVDTRKPLLKKITESLSLEPVGFVVSTESIIQDLLKEEPLTSAIIVELRSDQLKMILLQRGTSLGAHLVGRSGDPVADIVEALARFEKNIGNDHLPPKIILFSNQLTKEDLEEQQQQLLAQNWTEDKPFLHQPEIIIKSPTYLIKSITNHAAASVGGVVSPQENSQLASADEPPNIANEFGFTSAGASEKAFNSTEPATALPASSQEVKSFGIPIPVKTPAAELSKENQPMSELPSRPTDEQPTRKKKAFVLSKFFSFNKPSPKSHLPFITAGFFGGVLVLLGIILFFVQTNYKVVVELTLASELISKETTITLDPDVSEADVEKQLLPASLKTIEVSGQDALDTTGVTLVGDKAAGKVTLFNKTTSEKTFAAGTVLSAGDQTFSLDEEVTVEAASVSENDNGDGETKTYGKKEASATAEEIGAESNIEANTELTVASFDLDTYAASATEAFSGGSSREVRVVSEDDQVALKKQVTNALKAEAQQKLEDEAESGEYLIPTGEVAVVSTDFDAQVGDEVESLSLNLTVAASAYVYKNDDLKPLAVALLTSEVPDGFKLSDQDPQILSNPNEEVTDSGGVTLEANVSSQAVPEVNQDDLAKEVLGLPYEQAASQLLSNSAIKQAKITVQPPLLKNFFSQIPKDLSKVEVVIKEQ